MSTTTNAQICYGVVFEADCEFPWGNDIELWWRNLLGFRHSFEIYDESGKYINGVQPGVEIFTAYHAEQMEFNKAHPLPVELIFHCSCEYTMYILAVKGTTKTARRGYAVEFDPMALAVTDEQKAVLMEFCEKYGLSFVAGPAWFLTSWWC